MLANLQPYYASSLLQIYITLRLLLPNEINQLALLGDTSFRSENFFQLLLRKVRFLRVCEKQDRG